MPNQGWSYWAYKILSWMELKDSEILLQKLSFSLLSSVQGWHTRRLQAPSDLTAGSWCRGTSPLPALGDTKKSILNTFRNTPRHMKQVILRNFLCGSCGSMQGFAKLSLTQCSHITHQSHHIHTTLTLHVRRPSYASLDWDEATKPRNVGWSLTDSLTMQTYEELQAEAALLSLFSEFILT